jgi:hypothetical protein
MNLLAGSASVRLPSRVTWRFEWLPNNGDSNPVWPCHFSNYSEIKRTGWALPIGHLRRSRLGRANAFPPLSGVGIHTSLPSKVLLASLSPVPPHYYSESSRRTVALSNPAASSCRTMSATCFLVRSCGPWPETVILIPPRPNWRCPVFLDASSVKPCSRSQRSSRLRVTSCGISQPFTDLVVRDYGRSESTTIAIIPRLISGPRNGTNAGQAQRDRRFGADGERLVSWRANREVRSSTAWSNRC